MPLTVGVSYSASIQLTNATSAAIPNAGTALPPGITASFNSSNQRFTLSGTPTTAGTYNFTIDATNACDQYKVTNTNSSTPYTLTVSAIPVVSPQEALQFYYDNTLSLMARDIENESNPVQSWIPGGRFRFANEFNYFKWVTRYGQDFNATVSGISSWGVIEYSSTTTVLAIGVGFDEHDGEPGGGIKYWTNLSWNSNSEGAATYEYPNQLVGNVLRDYGAGIGVFNAAKSLYRYSSSTASIANGPGGSNGEDRVTNTHLAFIPGNWEHTTSIFPGQGTVSSGTGGFPLGPGGGTTLEEYVTYSVTIPAWSFALITAATDLYTYTLGADYYYQYYTLPSGCAVAYERIFDNGYLESVMDSIICNLSSSPKTVTVKLPWTTKEVGYDAVNEVETVTYYSYTLGRQCGIFIFQAKSNFNAAISPATSPPVVPAPSPPITTVPAPPPPAPTPAPTPSPGDSGG